MSEQASNKVRFRRWRYLIDWRSQLGVAWEVLAVLTCAFLLYAVGILFLTGDEPLFEIAAEDFQTFFLIVNAAFLLVSAAIFGFLAIILTHRFVGPAYVIEKAIVAMGRGDNASRLKLRKRDHLKSLAAEVEKLRARLQAEEAERAEALADLERCLVEGDNAAARELCTRLSGRTELADAPVAEARAES